MIKLVISFIVLMFLTITSSATAKAEDINPIGTGKHFLEQCEKLVIEGTAHSVSQAMQGSYCLGYINGLAQVYATKEYDNMYSQDIGIMYILYLKTHPNDLDQENSVLFKRMIEHK